jgi:hypothetical protein
MRRDEEDRLFAQEMAQSKRHFEDAVRQGWFQVSLVVRSDCAASRARSKALSETSALLIEVSRRIRAESAAVRKGLRALGPEYDHAHAEQRDRGAHEIGRGRPHSVDQP